MTDRDLVVRAGKGDHDAFAELARRSVGRLDSAANLILRDRELARDAVQEGYLAAWRDLPTLRDPDRWEAWIRRLVVRACFNVLRRRGRRPTEVEMPALFDPSVADATSLFADRELLDLALRRLQPEWRAVVVLHYYLGMPLPEVASVLGIPIGTAKSRHHRSLEALRLSVADLDPVRPMTSGAQYS
ncbi:MAG TPA: RNA polymerase sigma factor [Candidatus Limnocylindrales bacterium]|nr:RNA polymerase sigma factor [Candidatus Limnocylindrales bacterium]